MLALFEALGVDPALPAEVYHVGRSDLSLHRYEGWFYAVGQLDHESEDVGPFDLEAGPGPFKLYIHGRNNQERPAGPQEILPGLPLIQLNFETVAPWTLELPPPD